jgi:RNA 3'-terminal phosphate cyclase
MEQLSKYLSPVGEPLNHSFNSSSCFLGTAILLKPGIISGGQITHECPLSRSIGYFLEPVIMLAPFAKKPVHLTLRGITTDENDLSVSSRS